MLYQGYDKRGDFEVVAVNRSHLGLAVEPILAAPWGAEDHWATEQGVMRVLASLAESQRAMVYAGLIRGEFGGLWYLTDIIQKHSARLHGYGWPGGVGSAAFAIKWTMRQAFVGWEVERLATEFCDQNLGFVGLLSRLGWRVEGRHEHARKYRGQWHDTLTMRLLRHEWARGV